MIKALIVILAVSQSVVAFSTARAQNDSSQVTPFGRIIWDKYPKPWDEYPLK